MSSNAIWITGKTRSGKTSQLIQQLQRWSLSAPQLASEHDLKTALVFAANGDNRIDLVNRIEAETHGKAAFTSTTPLGFFENEVVLFWPLLAQQLGLTVQFPLRLRPETEQELATRLWQPELEAGTLAFPGASAYFAVRRSLDLYQLAALGEVAPDQISLILHEGMAGLEVNPGAWEQVGRSLLHWRQWCLERGLLTYGIITELFGRYLLPHPTYQASLLQRFRAVLADDVDEYPAVAQSLFSLMLDHSIPSAFTFNPDGSARLGLGADPSRLAELASRCQTIELDPENGSLGTLWGDQLLQWVDEPFAVQLPESIQAIQTVSRASLLLRIAEQIADAIHMGEVTAEEVAVIGPGFDPIARYSLRDSLAEKGIFVNSLNDQRPLNSSPTVRALLTLLALVYPGLGRSLDRERIAEMLVVLSQPPEFRTELSNIDLSRIDPVRAGLITDYCFVPDPEQPQLLPVTHFSRWDRLGHQAANCYRQIADWIAGQRQQQEQRLLPSPVVLLDRAIQQFLFGGSHLPYDQVAALRELMETAQHYWEVNRRLQQIDPTESSSSVVQRFIQLLQSGTITADPYPVRPLGPARQAVTLATIFQYRSYRLSHRWQFWLDASSALWLVGGGPLFGAPLFLSDWSGRPWTADDAFTADQLRLKRQLMDLTRRATERIILCHSDLSTTGQDQTGPLLTWTNAAQTIWTPAALVES